MPIIVLLIKVLASAFAVRFLASLGVGIGMAYLVNGIISDYLNRSIAYMNTALDPKLSAFLGLAGADDALSIMFGGVSFLASWKSMKLFFLKKS